MKIRAAGAELARRPGDRLAVVAGTRGDHARRALLGLEARELDVGAADLERARALQVLGLEQHRPAREPRERLRGVDRRDARDSVEPLARASRSQEVRVLSLSPSSIRNTFSSISRTAVSGSSSRACTSASSRRSSASSATACSRWRLARLDATAKTSRGEVCAAALLELPALLEEGAVLLDLLPQLGHVLAADRLGQHDRRLPLAARGRARGSSAPR